MSTHCPTCNCSESHVTETRQHAGETWRHRRCAECGKKFVTCEIAKRDNRPLRWPRALAEATRERLSPLKAK